MKQLFIALLLCSITCVSFARNGVSKPHVKTEFRKASQYSNTQLTYKIIPSTNGTLGYDIYAEGRKFIHQSSVPGLPGNDGFRTKAGAEKVAILVIEKIKKGDMPPTVEIEEMTQLRAM